MRRSLILLLLTLFLLTACQNREAVSSSGTADIALADITLTSSSFTLGQQNENPLYLTAETLAFYLNENRVHAEGMVFHQLDETGNTFIEGSAGSAEIDLESRMAYLSGGVTIRQLRDGMAIEGQSMAFDSQQQRVESSGRVIVEFNGGTVTGTNLSADLNASLLELSVIEEGVIEL